MQNEYIPEVGPRVIPAHVKEETINGIVNRPAPGTRMRVTLPGTETVLVGVVKEPVSDYALINLEIEGCEGYYVNDIMLWVASGWKFEVLPPLEVAEPELERELVDA